MSDINTDLRRKRKSRQIYLIGAAGILTVLLVLVGGWWLLFRSQVLWAQSINITGAEEIGQDRITALLQSHVLDSWLNRSLGYKNLTIWSEGPIATSALVAVPEVQSITIDKSYFGRSVTVHVTERARAGIWCINPPTGKSCFWFDDSGFIFKEAPQLEGSLITVTNDNTGQNLSVGQNILAPEYLPNFFSILKVLKTADVGIQGIRLDDLNLQELTVKTVAGPELQFSLRFPANDSLAVLNQLKPDFAKLQYVDFRVQNRAYYK